MAGRICCRLCLAPEEECVPIFNNFAADRQRLDQKILSCVQIKVLQEDNLSSKICHACISYLNSWQSFKNRCEVAERKQKSWIEIDRNSNGGNRNAVIQHVRELCPGVTIESIPQKAQPPPGKSPANHMQLKENGLQTESTVTQPMGLSSIKEEPKEQHEDHDERTMEMDLDPSQFLLQSHNEEDDDDDDDYDEGDMPADPPVLESLGLQHVSFNENMENFTSDNDNGEDGEDDAENLQRHMTASCSVCDMTFSNRANARRHERNIHGLRQNPANPLSAQVPQSVLELEYCGAEAPKKTSNSTPIISTSTGIPSIDLKQKIRMKLKSQRETYDYNNPARYRHLVTPSKLSFILRNLDFLEQAQDMKCKCCNKSYPSYKYFMGHMRKKYQNLPRNVCFKCLRQFTSKGQFIGHLKRKSCINLYTIVMKDDSIPKASTTDAAAAEFPRTKEVISNKSYGCKLCNKEFKSKINLRQHVLETHPEVQNSKAMPDSSCAFCQQVFEDPVLRQRHYNNLECVMFVVCCSCGERFEEHTAFVDHVYQHHLPPQQTGYDEYGYEIFDHDDNSSSSHLRNPQNCPVCNKQYNNYYNVLRHMESKHPNQLPQIYQCTQCSEGFPRQSELRDHVQSIHGESTPKQQKQQPTTNFPCKDCDQSFAVFSEWVDHQSVKHSRFNCLKCNFKSDSREAFTVHCFMEHRNFNTTATKVQLYSCRQCTNTYNSIDSLQDHIESQHNPSSGDPKPNSNVNKTASKVYETDSVEERSARALSSESTTNSLIMKTLNCRLCGFVLTDIEALRQHMNKIHGMDKKFFYCNQCTAKFMNDKGLRVHLFRIHGVRDEATPVNAGASLLKPIQQQTAASQHHIEVPPSTSDPESSETDVKGTASFECSVCHIVYKAEEQLKMHMIAVHPSSDSSHNTDDLAPNDSSAVVAAHQANLWFQCRYCSESFNTSKRLSIHMNTHEEHDKSDHSCKDCGGVYSTKKSLWVHRYKKHPKIPDASVCDVCSKVFFDKTELFYHTSQAHAKGNSVSNGNSHGEEFHEMQCTTDALFSMLDTSVGAANESLRQSTRKPDDTVYQCDMCPKTFHILNALQVHRGWHFRSPDGRKVRDPNDIWQPDQLPPSKMKKLSYVHRGPSGVPATSSNNDTSTQKNLPTCPYCYSTFASGNNLKRHIVEIHKRNETKSSMQQSPSITANAVPPSFLEKFRECTMCTLKFGTVSEWIDHKLGHARVQKPSQTFEWSCEICGKAFTRKERLLQHMISHLNDKESDGDTSNNVPEAPTQHVDGETNISERPLKSQEQATSSAEIDTKETHIKEEDEEDDDDDENIIEADFIDNEDEDDEEEDDEDEDDNNCSNEKDESENENSHYDSKKPEQYFCELCQVPFDSAESLRQHVSEHFLIGGMGENIKFSRRTSTDSASSTSSSSSKESSSNDAEIKQEAT